jgi:hypothetical protein
MRNLLAGLATLVILFAILGAVRNWYTVIGQPADLGKVAFRVEFDALKVGTDISDGYRFLHSKLSKAKEDASSEPKK